MNIVDLNNKFSNNRELSIKAIFANIFITQNRLQTIFDSNDSEITLKQFLLLVILKQSTKSMTFTQIGEVLGCSRQNIKKLALLLEKKGFVEIVRNPNDTRAFTVVPTNKLPKYFERVSEHHEHILNTLFEEYTDEEVFQFLKMITNLYSGIEKVEEEINK